MRVSVGLFVVLVAGPVLAEVPVSKRMDEELVRRRRELDQLEQRWADFTTECGCRRDAEALMAAVSDLAARSGAREVLVAPLDEPARCRKPGRRIFSVRLEASWHQLRGLLGEFTEMKSFTNVRELHLHGTGSGRIEVSFLLVVYDNPALTIDAVRRS